MRYRKLDADGDYAFGGGTADLLRDTPETVAQAVSTRLSLWKGEWFLDTSDGTPWLQDVLGKYSKPAYDMLIRQRILETPGVQSILEFDSVFNGDTRKLDLSARIDTIYGVAPIQETL